MCHHLKAAYVVALCLLPAVAGRAAAAPIVHNGAMAGPGQDHSSGAGQLITPEGWTPVNIDANRGDRLSLEASDRPGAGQCLHVKTFSGDAGVYQSLAPLEKGRTYLVSAWVKRLTGTLAVEAYPYAWGPAVMRRLEGVSSGWTRLTVGLTPIDGGAHLYLVAAPQADFLIDDVEVTPATVQVSLPEAQAYDLTDHWRYRLTVSRVPEAEQTGAGPREVRVQAVAEAANRVELSAPRRVTLPPTGAVSIELAVPLAAEGTLAVEVTDVETGEPLGGSPIATLRGTPWDVRYPYKDGLYASLQYRWPLRIRLQFFAQDSLLRLKATAVIQDEAGKTVRTFAARAVGDALVLPLDGHGLAQGEYRLRVTVVDDAGRVRHEGERPLRLLPPAPHEVVFTPEGRTLVDGKPFFPIGLYWVFADPAGWKPGPARKEAELRELRQAGFNSLHTYAFEHSDTNDTDENALAYLDTAQEFGFKVMMGVRRDWYQGEALDLAAIERRVRRLKDHPALLCWTLWDEPNFDPATAPRVQAMYDVVNRTDPYHPAMPVFGGPGSQPFRHCADADLFDCYPGAGGAGVLPRVLQEAHDALPEKPIWFVAQGHRSGPDGPLPSEQDMRLFAQHALEGGAEAIWWYSYGGDGKAWDSVKTDPGHWEEVKRVIGELARKVEAAGTRSQGG